MNKKVEIDVDVMKQVNSYEHIAKTALNQYPIIQEKLRYLGHSDNVAFYVETSSEKFLLRIHQSVSGSGDHIWKKPEIIESELMWLAALCREDNITVQEPVQNKLGQWVTQILAEDGAKNICCSLLRWIDGVIFDTQRTSQQAYQLGLLMAQLHQHGSQWKLPSNFERPLYDENHFYVSLSKLKSAVSSGLISAEHHQLFTAAVQKSANTMNTLEELPNTWGLIHADLHEGNYLFHNEQIRPIDFALCGFGYYLYDIASALQYLTPEVRISFLEGYQTIRQVPDHYVKMVEAFLIVAVLEIFSNHVNNPKEHKWLAESATDIADKHVSRFLNGESFLLDLY